MADLCLTYAEIVDLVEVYKGWASPTADNKAWALDRVNEGLRQFQRGQYYDEKGLLFTHAWRFLQLTAELELVKGVSTADGVPADAPGDTSVVNVDDAIFTSVMIGERVHFSATGNSYAIVSVGDTTSVTVTGDATVEADADTVTVLLYSVALPDNYGGLTHPVVFRYRGSTLYDLEERSPEFLADLVKDYHTAQTPRFYAALPGGIPTTTIQKRRMIFVSDQASSSKW